RAPQYEPGLGLGECLLAELAQQQLLSIRPDLVSAFRRGRRVVLGIGCFPCPLDALQGAQLRPARLPRPRARPSGRMPLARRRTEERCDGGETAAVAARLA